MFNSNAMHVLDVQLGRGGLVMRTEATGRTSGQARLSNVRTLGVDEHILAPLTPLKRPGRHSDGRLDPRPGPAAPARPVAGCRARPVRDGLRRLRSRPRARTSLRGSCTRPRSVSRLRQRDPRRTPGCWRGAGRLPRRELGTQVVDAIRRRVQQDTRSRRGQRDDPLGHTEPAVSAITASDCLRSASPKPRPAHPVPSSTAADLAPLPLVVPALAGYRVLRPCPGTCKSGVSGACGGFVRCW